MSQRQKQHMGRSEGDDTERLGRDAAADDSTAADAVDRLAPPVGRQPGTGRAVPTAEEIAEQPGRRGPKGGDDAS